MLRLVSPHTRCSSPTLLFILSWQQVWAASLKLSQHVCYFSEKIKFLLFPHDTTSVIHFLDKGVTTLWYIISGEFSNPIIRHRLQMLSPYSFMITQCRGEYFEWGRAAVGSEWETLHPWHDIDNSGKIRWAEHVRHKKEIRNSYRNSIAKRKGIIHYHKYIYLLILGSFDGCPVV
jgi:hypothetical protein